MEWETRTADSHVRPAVDLAEGACIRVRLRPGEKQLDPKMIKTAKA